MMKVLENGLSVCMNNIEDELGKIDETIINDITVTLILGDGEVELDEG